ALVREDTGAWFRFLRAFGVCANEDAGHDGNGEHGWISIFRDKRRTEDYFGVRSHDPHVARELDFDGSCEWFCCGYPAERPTRKGQAVFIKLADADGL